MPYAGSVTQPMSEPIPVLLKWFQMVGIPIKNLLRVSGQGEYDLVAGFALALLAVCHRPLLWYAWPSSAQGYESNCDCDSVVSKTLEWPRVSMRRHTHTNALSPYWATDYFNPFDSHSSFDSPFLPLCHIPQSLSLANSDNTTQHERNTTACITLQGLVNSSAMFKYSRY